jgi:hypothetical protein
LRVPLLVRWPAAVEPGVVSDQPTTSVDWFPTLAQIASAGRGEARGAGDLAGGVDGVSLLPVLRGERARGERALHFHYPHYIAGYRHDPARETWWNTPGAAIRVGTMKLVRRFDGGDELYDLAADPGESRDLSTERPETALELAEQLDRWLESVGADRPRRNLAYDPAAFGRELERALASLGGSSEWTPNGGCASSVRRGRLLLDCEETPFVVGPEMVLRGPLRVAVRFAAHGTRGAPALWYRSVDKPSYSGDRVALEPGGEPGVREGRIAAARTVRQLRIDFGRAKGGRAEADWIRVYRNGETTPLAEWTFDQ